MANQSKTMEGPESHGFPGAGIDLIQHEVRVNLFQVKEDKEFRLETLTFSGRMVIERGSPFTNAEGYKQIDFIVKSWVATAWSRVLKQEMIYILSQKIEQPISQITAQKKEADFPARIQFNVIFDALANNKVVKSGHEGRPAGHNFMSIPPAEGGDQKTVPTITTFGDDDIIDAIVLLDGPRVDIRLVDNKNSEQQTKGSLLHLRIKPLDCNDKHGKTMLTFVDISLPPDVPPQLSGLINEVPLPTEPRLPRKK